MKKSLVLLIAFVILVGSSAILARPVSCTEIQENSWTVKAPIPEYLYGCRAAVVDAKVYVIGNSANYMYDPAADNWTAKKPMPTPRMYFGIAVYENKIYAIGGRKGDSFSVNEVYDPSTDTWETKRHMPSSASDLDANVVDGKIYLICENKNEIYDVLNDSWTIGAPMPYPVCAYASTVFDNKVYVFGGLGGLDSVFHDRTQIFNPATNSWTQGAPMPNAQPNAAAAATTGLMAPKRIYVLGGDWGLERLAGTDVNQVYNPENDSWAFGASMPTGRGALTVVVLGDVLYAIGGFTNYVLLTNANEQYYPFGYGTIPPALSVIFPENTIYDESSVPLTFTVDRTASWVGYSLDGQDNVTVAGNITITSLANGLHNVTVYANDTFGNIGVSETVFFEVKVPEPLQTKLAIASGVSLAIAGIGLAVYFKKRKH